MLGSNDSDLDSLWYERLAETCHYVQDDYETALELYESSIAKPNHNWLCYRRMGEIFYAKNRTKEAIEHMEQALAKIKERNAPDRSDDKHAFAMLLLLGQYNYEASRLSVAASCYSEACSSPDAEQVVQAQLGLMRIQLHSGGDADGLNALVKDMQEKAGKGDMNSLLQHMALELDHQGLLLNMLDAVSQSYELLHYVLKTLQEALDLDKSISPENPALGTQLFEISSAKRNEAQGILLFYTGLATLKHRASLNEAEWSLRKFPGLWQQSVRQLLDCDSPNASFAHMNVISTPASHYFGIAMQAMSSKDDDLQLENLNAVEGLYLEDSSGVSDEPSGLLGVQYALRENREKSKETLAPRKTLGLQILYDDTPENDRIGFCYVQKAVEHYQDFENVAIAFSLAGPTDPVSEALQIVSEDVEPTLERSREGVDKECTLELSTHMRKEMLQTVQERVPSMSDQARRIEAAREHLDLIKDRTFPSAQTGSIYHMIVTKYSPETVEAALDIIRASIEEQISILEKTHTWRLSTGGWACDGRSANGQSYPNESGFATEFYHCLFCSDRDFHPGYPERVRNEHSDLVTVCSAKHKWLRMPPHGHEVFVGPRSKTVRKAICMHETEEDVSIWTVRCTENETEKLGVEDWKKMIAKQWGIPWSAVSACYV